MKLKALWVVSVGLCAVAATAVAQPAQYTSKQIIDTFSRKADAAPAQDQCEKQGMVTGDDGVCEPAKDSRGFSLPTRANLHAAGAPARSSTAAAARAMRPASRPERVAHAAPAPAAKRDLLITFKTGSSELTDQAKSNAKVFAEALDSPALTGARFDLDGYTDAQGDKGKNQTLSEARAASLKDYLVAQGVQGDRLVTHGYGASDFAVPSNPMAAQNRRVVARRID